jgi:PAS domain S-box-containing protein
LAQEKLRRREAYLAETEKLTHTGSWAWDVRTQKVLHCSDEMFRIFGLDPLESLPTRKNFRQRIHPEDRDWVDKRFEKLLRERLDSFDEYRALLPDGTVKHIMSSGHPVFDEDGELIEIIGTAVDITERKTAELERRRLASLVEQADDLMGISDLSGGTPIYLNKAGMNMVGFDNWEEARERRGIHYIFPEDRQFVNEVLWPTVLEKGSWSGEMRFRHFKTGDPIPILYSGFRIDDPKTGQPVNVGNVCRDITERKRVEAEARENNQRYHEMEMELAHANRVATMGQLTASIAHEIIQPLAATITNAETALRWLGRGSSHLKEVQEALTSIVDDSVRAAELVKRIRALMKKEPPRKDRLEVNGVILEILEVMRSEAVKHGVSILTELADPLPAVEADRVQLQQVLLNLIVNALEAMGADDEGRKNC